MHKPVAIADSIVRLTRIAWEEVLDDFGQARTSLMLSIY